MEIGVPAPTTSFVQVLYRVVQRCAWLVLSLTLAIMLGAEPSRALLLCQPAASCAIALDDLPAVMGDDAAVVELAEYAVSDDTVDPSDKALHRYVATAHRIHFAAQAEIDAARITQRQRSLFPDKTGPPRV